MKLKELKDSLVDKLSQELKCRGFSSNKRHIEFTKKNTEGWYKYQLIFLEREVGWEINPVMLIRKNIVEDIYHQALNTDPKYHKITATIGITVEKYLNDGETHRFKLISEEDITTCFTSILREFDTVVKPFFIRYDSIVNIEKAVNTEHEKSIFSGLKYEGNVGMILARIVDNPNYKRLEVKYRDYYRVLSDGFYLPSYERLLNILKDIEIGNSKII